jgi:hypothetical protein
MFGVLIVSWCCQGIDLLAATACSGGMQRGGGFHRSSRSAWDDAPAKSLEGR